MAFTQDFRTQRRNFNDGETRIGEKDRIWYDSSTNSIRISDGVTPGGIIVGGSGGGGNYTLPTASSTTKGGVKIGSNITITDGVISVAAPFSGSYNDLTNKPTIPSLTGYATETYVTTRGYLTSVGTISYNDLSNKPTLFSGSYTDLSNKPTLFDGAYSSLSGKPALFSGSYTDLTDKPTIPSLTGYATETFVTTRGYLTSVGTISYNDLSNKPALFDGAYDSLSGKPTLFSGSYTDLSNKPALFDGAYDSLSGKPTLFSGSYTDLTSKPTIYSSAYIGTTSLDFTRSSASQTLGGVSIDGSVLWINATPAPGDPFRTAISAASGNASISLTSGLPGLGSTVSWTFDTTKITFPDSSQQTTAYTGNAATVTNGVYTTDTGTVTNTMLAGSIANDKLSNSSITVNGTSISLGSSATVTSAADTLTGSTLASGVTSSSLTSVGTLTGLTVTAGATIQNGDANPNFSKAQLTFGYNSTSTYPHWIHTTHNAGSAAINAFHFYTSDGTQNGVFPTNGVLGLTITNGDISTGAITSTYTPSTATGSALSLTGKDTQGGTGYFDFLKATNTTSGVTNANKTFRLNSTGTVEIINSAYSATIFSLSDAGALSVSGPISVNGKQAVNGPAFRAYVDSGQTISTDSQQKVTFGTETFDTNGNFSSSRFTPTIEGYYQLNATVRLSGNSGTGECMIILYKNGSEYARGTNESGTEQGQNFWSMQVSDIAYANGSSDYFEIYIQQGSANNRTTTAGQAISYFSGCMIRGA